MANGTVLNALCRYLKTRCGQGDAYFCVAAAVPASGMRTIDVLTTSRICRVRVTEDFCASDPNNVETFLDAHGCPRLFMTLTVSSGRYLAISTDGVRLEPA